jgi:hypothetical protein
LKKNLSPLILRQRRQHFGERLLLLFSGGLFSGGLLNSFFFRCHRFLFFGLPGSGIFSFSEAVGIMLAVAEFVNGVKQNIFGPGLKLIVCYHQHLWHTVRHVI